MSNLSFTTLMDFITVETIPNKQYYSKTFLEIANQPHYENVISNIYAFYFDSQEEHGLGKLFVDSLIELLKSKHQIEIEEQDYLFVETEVVIEDQKRIDIALFNHDIAIIIENKIYHHLNNDLKTYFNHYKQKNKYGIVLSLLPVSDINNSNFKNLLHKELLDLVIENLTKLESVKENKYVTFLNDLHHNIIKLSTPEMNAESVKFYFQNQEKINRLSDLKFEFRDHLRNEALKVGKSMDNIRDFIPRKHSFNEKRLVHFVSNVNEDLMITVVYEPLMKGEKNFYIAIDLKNDLLKDRVKYNNIEFTDDENDIAYCEEFEEDLERYWSHFSLVKYEPSEEEIYNFSECINKLIKENHFLEIFRKLESFIKNGFVWKEKIIFQIKE